MPADVRLPFVVATSADPRGGLVFDPLFSPTDFGAGRAPTGIPAPRRRRTLLPAGSDEAIAAWVDGKEVRGRNVYRRAEPDQDAAEIDREETPGRRHGRETK